MGEAVGCSSSQIPWSLLMPSKKTRWEGEAGWRKKPCKLGERGDGVGQEAVWDDLALVDAYDHTVAT
uniref:Survival Motor Neuron Gemin2-binding domain-containing protein n=1 Tax=Triticum urartu TaxID=4572 RepID=A0A8R7UCR2_TRIUA